MAKWHECTGSEVREFWVAIEDVLVNGEYSEIKKLGLSMRNSYYHLLTFVSEMYDNGEINDKQLYYWGQEEAYNFFTQDKWSQWEKNHNWQRPKAKDPTKAYYKSELLDLTLTDEKLIMKLRRSRGFIFVEKSGFLQDLKLISSYGWTILAGEGFSSRELRETIMRSFSDRPIVVLHDFDVAGAMIHEVFEKGSKRTDHLDLTFDNVIDLGLREEDTYELELPRAPESKRVRDKNPDAWRVELNALTILTRTHKIKNPLLWYVAKRMYEEGLDLYEESESLHKALVAHISGEFWSAIYPRVFRKARKAIKKFAIQNEDITKIMTNYNHSNYAFFNGSEFDGIDRFIEEIIWREIVDPIIKDGDDVAKELLEKAEVEF